jgi:hypothetical protein
MTNSEFKLKVSDEYEGQPYRHLEILYKYLEEYNEKYDDGWELEDDWWLELQRKVYEKEENEGILNPIVDIYSLLYLVSCYFLIVD